MLRSTWSKRALTAARGLLLALPLGALTAYPRAVTPTHFTLVPIGPGIYAAIAKPRDPPSAANTGFVVGSTGVLVIDSFASRTAAEELLAAIRGITPLPVKWVVNTRDDPDHTGGNAVFKRQGATVVAHENVRTSPRADEKGTPGVVPEVTHRHGLSIWLGKRQVEILSRAGHSSGDSVVALPDDKVLFAGDLLWKNTVPSLSDAQAEAWLKTLDGFLEGYPSATFVPGHGELARAIDVRYFRDYLSGLRLAVARQLAQGQSGKALVEAVLSMQRSRFGAWEGFGERAEKNVELAEEEIKGVARTPAATPAVP